MVMVEYLFKPKAADALDEFELFLKERLVDIGKTYLEAELTRYAKQFVTIAVASSCQNATNTQVFNTGEQLKMSYFQEGPRKDESIFTFQLSI